MMYDLPEDLVREILSRVPVISLRRLQSTCKRWNDLFIDPEFIKKQFNKSKESMLGMLEEVGVFLMNINDLEGNYDLPTDFTSKHITLKDSYYNSEQFGIVAIFSCDGLLLCNTMDKIGQYRTVVRLVVWNPCLGQTRWIEPSKTYTIFDSFVLGYDSNNKYKILRNFYRYGNGSQKSFEIYDYNLNSWKFLDEDVISDDWDILGRDGVSLSGNTYWLGYEDKSSKDVHMLISFDFSAEKFQRHCLPPCFQLSQNDSMALSVVRREQLLLLHQSSRALKMEIWVTTNDKIDQAKVLTWSKFLNVDLYTHRICFSNGTSFFVMDEEKKIVFCCDTTRCGINAAYIIGEEENGVRQVLLGQNYFSCPPLMFSYVPSLVQIQHGSGGGVN